MRKPVQQFIRCPAIPVLLWLTLTSAMAAPDIFRQPTNQVVAPGQTAMFNVGVTGAPPLSYQWRRNDTFNIPRGTNAILLITNVQPNDAGRYSVLVTEAGGASTLSSQAVLTVYSPVSILTQPQSQTVIAGEPALFTVIATGAPPPRYQWFAGADPMPGATNDSLLISNASPTDAGTYWVRVRNFVGTLASFEDSAPAMLTVVEPPRITREPQSETVLAGSSVTLSVAAVGTEQLRYQWFLDGMPLSIAGSVANSPDLVLSPVLPHHAGDYFAVVSNDYGKATSSIATLTVLAPARIITEPRDGNVTVGGSATFMGQGAGTAPLFYQWFFNGSVVSGATNPLLTISDAQLGDEGEYRLAVSNAYGADLSAPAMLNVLGVGAPVITSQPTNQTNFVGTSAAMSVAAEGSEPMFYQWFFNGNLLPDRTNTAIAWNNLKFSDRGNYRVMVSNAYGMTASAIASLEVRLQPLLFVDNFEDMVPIQNAFYLAGSGSNVGATREPEEPLHDGKRTERTVWLAWTAPTNGIVDIKTLGSDFDTVLAVYTGSSSSSNDLALIGSDDDGETNHFSALSFNALAGVTYRIVVAGYWKSEGNIAFELRFNPTANRLPEFTYHPPNLAVCFGAPAPLQITYATDEPVQIRWLFRNAPLANVISSSNWIERVEDEQVGRYQVVIITPTATNYSRIGDLQINTRCLPDVFARDKLADAMDSGHYLRLGSVTPGDGKKKPATGTPKFGSGSHGFSGTQIFSSVGATSDPGEPIHCGVGAGKSEWYAYQAEMDGTLRVDTDGSSFDTVLAVYIGPGDSYSTLTNVVCDDNSGSNGLTSKVVFQATSNTIYWIAVDGKTGSSPQVGTVRLNYRVGNPVTIGAQPESATVPSGTNVTFTVDANGMTNYLFQWRWFGTNLPGAIGSNFIRALVSQSHSGPYDVVVRNPINSVTSSVAMLTVYSGTLNITEQPQSITALAGTNISFAVAASGVGALTYQWRFEGTNLPGATSNVLTVLNVQPLHTGTYAVNVTDANGSKISSNATLTVLLAPIITLQPQSQTVPSGGGATLMASASGIPAPTYQWFFNQAPLPGETASTLNVPDFQGSNAGVYSMVASNVAGVAQTVHAELFLNAPLRFTNLVHSNGAISVRLIGLANTNYIIQASTNNSDWVTRGTNSSPTGIWNFTDAWTNLPMRTYRALTLP